MGLRKKLDLEWDGKRYPLLVTMEVVEGLEEVVNLTQLNLSMMDGDLKVSHACKLIALILNEAGAEVTTEDVYTEVFTGDQFDMTQMMEVLNLIFSAVFPEPKKK